MAMTIRPFVLGAAIFLLPFTVVAEDVTFDEGAQLVAAFVNDIATLQGRFEQSLVDAMAKCWSAPVAPCKFSDQVSFVGPTPNRTNSSWSRMD